MNAIETRNLSKKYILYPDPKYLFKEIFRTDGGNHFDTKWAIKDINFSVVKGQVCALIGRNGSGKSTLLGLLSKVISPTAGELYVNGKVSSILELGAGFQQELTGRQNIQINGSILGLSKGEINNRMESIIEFSELETQIDNPVKTYSSGMMLRLGFAIAVHIDFDVLLVDEILAVGDLLFQRKCLSKMREFKESGKTIILATHNLADAAAICDRIILLDEGRIIQDGPAETVIRSYWEQCEKEQNRISKRLNPFKSDNIYGEDIGDIKIKQVRFLDEGGKETATFETGKKMIIRISFHAFKKVENPLFRIQFFRNDGLWVHGANTYRQGLNLGTLQGNGEVELLYEKLNLLEADYFVNIGIWPDEYRSFMTDVAFDLHEMTYVIHVKSKRKDGGGIVCNPFRWKLLHNSRSYND